MKTELKYGLIFSAMQLVWLALEFVSGLQTTHKDLHPIISMFIIVPSVIILTMGIRAKKKELHGTITFQQAFIAGAFISFIVTMLSPFIMFIFDKLINPNFFLDFQHYAVENEVMNMEQAKDYFNLKNYMIQSAMGTMVMGTVISAVIALIVQPKKKNAEKTKN